MHKVALIGLGNIGARHLRALMSINDVKIVAVCDINKTKKSCLENFEHDKPVFYNDYKKLLKETDAEIVSIATPHGLHAIMAIEAMKAGKHVIVEKPMALTSHDCDNMNLVAKKTGKRVFVIKQNRFNKPILITAKALEENRLGKIYLVQCNVFWNRNEEYYINSVWRGKKKLEGGALHTQVSHFLDLLIWWFGDIKQAKTFFDTLKHKIEIEDVGVSAIKFESGALGTISWTTNVYNKNYEGSITIIGEKGTIKIGGEYLNKIEYWDVMSYPLPDNIDLDDVQNNYGSYFGSSANHNLMFNEIIHHFTEKRKGVVEGEEGEKTVKATEMIYGSI